MYTDFGLYILFWMKNIIVFASALAMLVFGILIASNKVKSTKVLGISFIVSAIASAVSNLLSFLIRYVNVEIYARYSVFSSTVSYIATFAAALCICIFIHKNYGKKFIYIPIMLLHVGALAANFFVRMALNKSAESMQISAFGYWMSLTSEINSLVTGTVAAVIIIAILYKNRNIEKVVPKLWIFRIITFIWSLMLACYRIISYSVMIASNVDGEKNMSVFAQIWSGNMESSTIMTDMLSALVALIIPIYILLMVNAVSRKEKLESSHI